ncbi:recombinase family protein [Solirubrobacter ginsenosidimutans]|uniref:Recombinase family protein n=1 Tax=Solirubrobacter ginsenosidimutans TaxID=490573 RepID=A0A9X3MSZ4_9ACTN|nr:recombinase family protein [Solirubrobacter ginsenosidimutans]MDA0161291.1 recombinase family protein [Solirubrobacter ginsenosidimutans]
MDEPRLVVDGYVRVSRVGPRSGERFISPDLQREYLEAWARSRGARLLRVVEELDESGARADRPLLLETVARVEAGISDGVVVAWVDRFGRTLLDSVQLIERIRSAGGEFFAAQDGLDTRTEAGRMVMQILLSTAEWQLARYRQSWHDAKLRAVYRGVFIASVVPVGYRRTRSGRLRPDPRTAPLIGEAFALRADGWTLPELGRWFERHDVRTAKGNCGWSYQTVRNTLANRAYLGEVHFGLVCNERAHPPLVPGPVWQAAQSPTRRSYGNESIGLLLAGLVRCASCSRRMAQVPARRKDGVHRTWGCRGAFPGGRCPRPAYIANDHLEPVVSDVMFELLARRRGAPLAAVANALHGVEQAAEDLARYRDSSRVHASLGEDAFVRGLIARQQRLRSARLDAVDAQRRVGVHQLPPVEELERDWSGMPSDARRQVMNTVIECVFVEPGRGHTAERTTICPAGTAPHDLSSLALHATPLRRFAKRRDWINAGKLGASQHRWSPRRVERELRAFTRNLDQWPARELFANSDRLRLYCQIVAQGGEPVWADRIGLPIAPRVASPREWTDERIRAGLTLYLEDKVAWPTEAQFVRDGLRALSQAVAHHGGRARWSKEFTQPCRQCHNGGRPREWTDPRIRAELAVLCAQRDMFPPRRDLRQINDGRLLRAIDSHHGLRWWADQFGLEPTNTRPDRRT